MPGCCRSARGVDNSNICQALCTYLRFSLPIVHNAPWMLTIKHLMKL